MTPLAFLSAHRLAPVWGALLLQAHGAQEHGHSVVRFFFHFGLAGLPLLSAVDSSFVPLPVPGVTDILLILYAAGHANPVLLVGLATLGSAAGGYVSHAVGRAGGMAFLEKHVPQRLLRPISAWMESHAILAVALPALLPPPMPLSPFVLMAGAVNMSRRTFMAAFTASRFVRHCLAVWIGLRWGRPVLRLWNHFSARWGVPVLVALWAFLAVFTAIALWRVYRTARELKPNPA